MSTDQGLYRVLGVDPSASSRQIANAYRALMRRHHPDTRPGPSSPVQHTEPDHDAALQQISAAYAVLRDPQLRADYDTRQAQHARRRPQPPTHDASQSACLRTGPPVILGQMSRSPRCPAWIAIAEEPPSPSPLLGDLLHLLMELRRQ